jgi:hypothetical protein
MHTLRLCIENYGKENKGDGKDGVILVFFGEEDYMLNPA